jgi:predicted transcriptional regulator
MVNYTILKPRMKAELLFRQRIDYDDGAIVEMVLWRVPSPVPPAVHGLKYSLFYGRPGVREVGYDNERGKGDHRHFQGSETAYVFTGVEQLVLLRVRLLGRCADLARWEMSDVKITVGGAIEEDASRQFVNAWRRAERGETFHERHLAFESWDALARLMTGKRMELLHYVRRHKVASVRALAKALGRDYSNVHADVQALTAAGLLDSADGGVQADYDVIETKIAI